ncbi:lytic transglycosylase domain-containing protein [Leptolyngbya sp. 7M]|uniref:lytic transglycosylase domain-containing protein n=1 Tax=Leptolyngbya sp. 7M TaxID=2812896 RepID=UPI001B8D129A|nr:lytic transglycosylase domain-containing protein [Leptolyngbya sp. 7M]QYO65228.1 transglycosylase SLT domain-containing protein [Leptolyngbya sp. 7M]
MNSFFERWAAVFLLAVSFGVHVAIAQTPEVLQARVQENRILEEASKHFRDGMMALTQDRRADSGNKFDQAVEVFLSSGINIQSNEALHTCYTQLIETVYRIEFPSDLQTPQIRGLSAACRWNFTDVDFVLADKVLALAKPALKTADRTPSSPSSSGQPGEPPADIIAGFDSQVYEPSPLDELSRLELTSEEMDIENDPVAQQQYQYIQYAVANRSLGFTFQVHPMIQQFINYYRGRGRKTMEVGLYRSGMFMSMARRIFREEGVPENVAWLGQVESAWKPTAMSWASASGLWQFIPGTGARYGLRRTAFVDERNSFEEATRASARYLKFLFNRYNNWELAMAGYNCGEGNVDRAIRRAGVANFWAAYPYLPRETRNYVPNILATILIANNPAQYGFGHVRPAPPLRYDRIRVPASTNLNLIAQAADTTVQYIRYLNPHLRTNTTPPEPYIINVPAGKSDDVVAVFRRIPATKVGNTNLANSVQGETWQTLSNRTGVSVAELMAANPGMKQPTGKVFVPVNQVPGNRVTATSYSRPVGNSAPVQSNVKVVKAQAGDTVAKVASRHGADPTEVAKFNGLLVNSVLGAGREIKIPTR